MTYRRKAKHIEATQWTGDNIEEVRRMIGDICGANMSNDSLYITNKKLETILIVSFGEYLIRYGGDFIDRMSRRKFNEEYETFES